MKSEGPSFEFRIEVLHLPGTEVVIVERNDFIAINYNCSFTNTTIAMAGYLEESAPVGRLVGAPVGHLVGVSIGCLYGGTSLGAQKEEAQKSSI